MDTKPNNFPASPFVYAVVLRISQVNQRLLSAAPSLADDAVSSVAGQSRSANVESQGSGLLASLMGEPSVTPRWVRGEINNFQVGCIQLEK